MTLARFLEAFRIDTDGFGREIRGTNSEAVVADGVVAVVQEGAVTDNVFSTQVIRNALRQ